MVAGKVRMTIGLRKSPAPPKPSPPPPKPPLPPPRSGKVTSQRTVFSRSFGVHLPRSSSLVQPRPPDVTELLRLVEELRDRESRLKTELLEFKLLRESVNIVPVLEKEIVAKDAELEIAKKKTSSLETENERLKKDVNDLTLKCEEEKSLFKKKEKALEAEIQELKKKTASLNESEELSYARRFQGLIEVSNKSTLLKNLKKGVKSINNNETIQKNESSVEVVVAERPSQSRCDSEEVTHAIESTESTFDKLRGRGVPRIPKPPPPRRSNSSSSSSAASFKEAVATLPPPPPPPFPPPHPTAKVAVCGPPPPPPPPKGLIARPAKVQRVPEVVEFYHSLMRRDSKRDSGAGISDPLPATVSTTVNTRDMIGEIENRSSHLLAIKTDVETQGDFIRFLIKEVENAAFADIEDVVPFVKWLDDELSYLVDERAVLKHFDWPEQKADALREAAFGYSDLKKLESEASSFRDDSRLPCGPPLKKMQSLLEKLEQGVYNLSRIRESAAKRFKGFEIPMYWMLETGTVTQIKLASVKLAMKYMKRTSAELETVGGGPEEEELIVQGVRFAFRVHQFAGGFDAETMRAFQELRDKARSCHAQSQNQQQRMLYRSTTSC